ncbi:hypothetical protein ACN47E_010194 [Coniothyrium glycines]
MASSPQNKPLAFTASMSELATRSDLQRLEDQYAILKAEQEQMRFILDGLKKHLVGMAASHNVSTTIIQDDGSISLALVNPGVRSNDLPNQHHTMDVVEAVGEVSANFGSLSKMFRAASSGDSGYTSSGRDTPDRDAKDPREHTGLETQGESFSSASSDHVVSAHPESSLSSTTDGLTALQQSNAVPDERFPILRAALEHADAQVLATHVEFPRPHLPIPWRAPLSPSAR